MADRCLGKDAKQFVDNYIDNIRDRQKNILRHFNDMDLENADVQKELVEIINNMLVDCDNLINELGAYDFY